MTSYTGRPVTIWLIPNEPPAARWGPWRRWRARRTEQAIRTRTRKWKS